MRKIWDISPPIHSDSPVFPGDTRYSQQWVARINATCPVNVSAMTLSPHVGAHADAPLHYDSSGASIGAVDLEAYLGPCRVIHATGVKPLVLPNHLAHAIDRTMPARVLVRTYSQFPLSQFDSDLAGFHPDTIVFLADRGVRLIGIDSASIDPADSKTLDGHQIIRARGLRVLENLYLDEVAEGDYELIALPLKLTEADASPVRAVLRELD